MRVIGSQAMSTSWPGSSPLAAPPGAGIVLVMAGAPVDGGAAARGCRMAGGRHAGAGSGPPGRPGAHQERTAPVVSSRPGRRHLGSLSSVRVVTERRVRTTAPYGATTALEARAP